MSPIPIHDRYLLPAKVRILNAINRANQMSLTFEDVVFSPPWFTPSIDGNNTKISVIASGRTAVSGQFAWSYRRDSLNDLFGLAQVELFVDDSVKTTADLLAPLLHRYGVNLEPSDILDVPIPDLNGNETTVSLDTTSSSHGWYGSLRIKLRPKGVPLGLSIVNTRDTGPFTLGSNKTIAEIYYRWKTLHNVYYYPTLLSGNIQNGTPVDTSLLVNMVKEIFDPRFHWTPNTHSEFNLYGATVAYLGPNDGNWSIAGTYDDITLAIRLGEHCSNFTGYLLIKLPSASIAYFNSLPVGDDDEEEQGTTDPGETPGEDEETGTGGQDGTDPSGPEEPEPTDPEDTGEDEEQPSDQVDPEEPEEPTDPVDPEDESNGAEDEDPEGSEPEDPADPSDPGEEPTP